jgi:hypothetical protein
VPLKSSLLKSIIQRSLLDFSKDEFVKIDG